jgi:hypothetical protein
MGGKKNANHQVVNWQTCFNVPTGDMAALTFYRAAAGVTRSAYLLETRDARVLFEKTDRGLLATDGGPDFRLYAVEARSGR